MHQLVRLIASVSIALGCSFVAGCSTTSAANALASDGYSQVTGWWTACGGCGTGPFVLYYKGTHGLMSFNGQQSPCAGDKIETAVTLSADGKMHHVVALGCGDRFEGDLTVGESTATLGSIYKVFLTGLKWGP